MEKRLILLFIIFLLPACFAADQNGKISIEQAYKQNRKELSDVFDKIKQKYKPEFEKVRKEYEKERDKVADYSTPLIEAMYFAADNHDKQKLQELIGTYMAMGLGDKWLDVIKSTMNQAGDINMYNIALSGNFLIPDIVPEDFQYHLQETKKRYNRSAKKTFGFKQNNDTLKSFFKDLGFLDSLYTYTPKNIDSQRQQLISAYKKFSAQVEAVHDKYYNPDTSEDQKVWDKVRAGRKDYVAKKYNLPDEIARFWFMPFSVQLVQDMARAAYNQNTDQLKDLLSNYFTKIYGKDWRQKMEQRKKMEFEGKQYGELERAPFVDEPGIGFGVTAVLAALYFKERLQNESKLADKLLKKLFNI